mmetsp:Transcript_110456/g.356529  ORF Transcript_110456/g.356529 Transcript_110456/m.356529 type:complete len:289 (-) Transcript_110456:702-1568(-)
MARLATLIVFPLDGTEALAEAYACGFMPLAPSPKRTWHGSAHGFAGLCWRALPQLHLRPAAAGGAVVGQKLEQRAAGPRHTEAQRALPRSCGHTTACWAALPSRPLLPIAIVDSCAMAGAIGHLLGGVNFASPSTMVGQPLDSTVPIALVAALRASAPLGPRLPNAVDTLLVLACGRTTWRRLLQGTSAGMASVCRWRHEATGPVVVPGTRCRASAPLGPLAEDAIGPRLCAGGRCEMKLCWVTRLDLPQCFADARGPQRGVELRDDALPLTDAEAGTAARGPIAPCS